MDRVSKFRVWMDRFEPQTSKPDHLGAKKIKLKNWVSQKRLIIPRALIYEGVWPPRFMLSNMPLAQDSEAIDFRGRRKTSKPKHADSNIIKLKCLGIAKTMLHHSKVKSRVRNPKRNFQKSRKLKFRPISQLKPFFEPWGADIGRFLRFGFRV